jgi:hypothetical protein
VVATDAALLRSKATALVVDELAEAIVLTTVASSNLLPARESKSRALIVR